MAGQVPSDAAQDREIPVEYHVHTDHSRTRLCESPPPFFV